jgi:putative ABC transport system permease protein
MTLIAWRNIIRHKLRSAFLALCIIIGVAFVAGTFVLTDTIKNVFNRVFDEAYQGVDVSVRTRSTFGSTEVKPPMPEALLATVQAVPGVRIATGNIFTIGGRIFDLQNKPVGNQFAPTFLASWPLDKALNSFSIASGAIPNGPDEVVIDLQAVTEAKFKLGDRVRVQTSVGIQNFRLVGTAKYGSASNLGGASAALFDLATAQAITGRNGTFDDIAVAAEEDVAPSTLQDRVQKAVGAKFEALTGTELSTESTTSINDGFSFITTFLLAFAGISLFVGASIVYNTFGIVVAQRTKEMALLRALGADGSQVIGSVLIESIFIGLLASALGLLGGIGLGVGMMKLLGAVGFKIPTGPVTILTRTIVVSILGGMLITVISAVAPALRAARVPPLAAVRRVTVSTAKQKRSRLVIGAVMLVVGVAMTSWGSWSMSLIWLGLGALSTMIGASLSAPTIVRPFVHLLATPIRKLRGVSGQLAEENATSNARRTSDTAAALMIGTTLIAASLVLASSIRTSTDRILAQGLHAELIVSAEGITGLGTEATAEVGAVPGVSSVAPFRSGSFKIGESTKRLSAMSGPSLDATNPADALDLDVASGSMADVEKGGLAVSERLAKDNDWKVGDKLAMTFASGPNSLPIVAVFKSNVFGDYFISLKSHEAFFTDSADQLVFVRVAKNADLATVQAGVAKTLKLAAPAAKVRSREEYAGQVRAQVTQILNLITGLVLLAIFIALLGVLITMLLSVLERTHELGLLRAVGMDRRDVRSMVRWEAAIISTFGAVLGVVLGVGLGYSLSRLLREQGITAIEIPIRSLITMVLAITLAGVGASLYPARRASKLNILTAIATD